MIRAGLRGGQLPRAPRSEGALRDENFCFKEITPLGNCRDSEAIQECNSIFRCCVKYHYDLSASLASRQFNEWAYEYFRFSLMRILAIRHEVHGTSKHCVHNAG